MKRVGEDLGRTVDFVAQVCALILPAPARNRSYASVFGTWATIVFAAFRFIPNGAPT